jgi:hypothetical protein
MVINNIYDASSLLLVFIFFWAACCLERQKNKPQLIKDMCLYDYICCVYLYLVIFYHFLILFVVINFNQ